MTERVQALMGWTGKESATIIFDSTTDEFTRRGFFDKIRGKPNIALVATTSEGDVFGGFYSVAVNRQSKNSYDRNMFIFSFESHGRCATPQKFCVKEGLRDQVRVRYSKNDNNGFVGFWANGNSGFRLGNENSDSNCFNLSNGFEGVHDTTLTGKNGPYDKGPYHHCSRLVAVQLS